MKKKICAALALLLCLSLCLILAPGAFAEGEGTYPVRFYNEKNYDLVGLTVFDADGSEIAPAEIGDGYTYLLTPGTYSYVYHDSRGIFLDIEETIFSVVSNALEIPVTLTASFADEIGFTVGVNPAFIGEVEELTPEEYEQRRQELLDLMVRNLISKSEAEQGFSVSDNEVFYAGESSSDQVHAAIKAAMLQHADQTDFLVFYTNEAWNMDQCTQFIKDACSHTGRQREGDTLFYGYSHCGYSWYPDEYNESTGLYRHNLCFTFWYRTTLDQELTTAAKVESIVSELNLSGKSDYEKAYAINQWLYMNVDYDYDRLEDDTYTLKFTDYAALLDEVAVCQGFALSFYRLALEAGLDARYIRSSQMSHAWNIVRLNGVYYELDATWDSNWREGGTPLSQLPHFFARGSSWWLQNHTLNGQTYSTIGDQFYSGTEDYDPLFNTYTLSTVDYDPNSVVPVGLAVNATNFPDSVFRAYVSNNFDKDGNGYLSDSEIQDVTTILFMQTPLTTLKGIEHFPMLETLYCIKCGLDTLDVSHNTRLVSLFCSGNNLETLNISQNTALEVLNCGCYTSEPSSYFFYSGIDGNRLSALDVSHNTALRQLYCGYNALNALDVSQNPALNILYCEGNELTVLNVGNNSQLRELYCGKNQLKTLNTSGNTMLEKLYCYGNQLSSLDLSRNTALLTLYCGYSAYAVDDSDPQNPIALGKLVWGNRINNLDLSSNTLLTSLHCDGNELSSLDLQALGQLTDLACGQNGLEALNVSNLQRLQNLSCFDNELSTLDLIHNNSLTALECYGNPLHTLDLRSNSVLRGLDCSNAELSRLLLGSNEHLAYLACGDNPLIHLDLTDCPLMCELLEEAEGQAENGWIVYRSVRDNLYLLVDADVVLTTALVPDLILPGNLTAIEEDAFSGGAFTYAMLPNKAVSIAKGAFANCPNLFYIYIPMQTEDIDPHAFDGVSDLTILGITGSAAQDYAEDYGFIFKPAS